LRKNAFEQAVLILNSFNLHMRKENACLSDSEFAFLAVAN